jgi:hypothetical protein
MASKQPGTKPTLADVLASVQTGRTIPLSLTPTQKSAFRDRDGRLALSVLRHLLGARAISVRPSTPRDLFPLTEATFQAIARRLGYRVGIKRSRQLLRRLTAAGVIASSGSYRQRYRNGPGSTGFRVTLYRLKALVGFSSASSSRKRAVGRHSAVKRNPHLRWWHHPLFGTPDGRPPPELTPRQRRLRSADERCATWGRSS